MSKRSLSVAYKLADIGKIGYVKKAEKYESGQIIMSAYLTQITRFYAQKKQPFWSSQKGCKYAPGEELRASVLRSGRSFLSFLGFFRFFRLFFLLSHQAEIAG